MVSGPVSDGLLDWDEQIVDPQWAAEKLAQWFSDLEDGGFDGTIHQMHSPLLAPAGKGKDLTFEDGVPWVRAKVVEPTAIKLVDEKVYRGFSIGILDPPIYPDLKAKNGRIGAPGAGGFINEVSLVDVPANPRCLFSLAKRAKSDSKIKATGVIEIVDGDDFVPLHKATREQLTKAFVRSLSPSEDGDALSKVLSSHLEQKQTSTEKPKKGKKMTDTATKAKEKAADSMPEGAMKCKSCKGTDCTKCEGKGWTMPESATKSVVPADAAAKARATVNAAASAAARAGDVAGAAVGAAVTHSLLGKSADDDVDDALDDLGSDVADALTAQGEDLAAGDGKPSDGPVTDALVGVAGAVSAAAAAQGADEMADVMSGKKKGGKVKKDKAEKPAKTDKPAEGDGKPAFPGAAKPFGSKDKKKGKGKIPPQFLKEDQEKETAGKPKKKSKKGKKKKKGSMESTAIPATSGILGGPGGPVSTKGKKSKKKGKDMPSVEKRLHDILCPAFGSKSVKSAYGVGKDLPITEVLSPEYFAARLYELSSARKGTGDVAEAFADLAASTKLSALKPATFLEIKEAASRKFMSEYPDVHLRPQMIDPESFRRPFIAGATPETSSVTRVPMPDMKDQFGPGDFQRGPLTTDQARPTLSGGTSVAKGKKGKGATAGAGNPNSRSFYTNAAKDESQNAMAMLHDHIVSRYPGVCPMEAQQPGTAIDSDGLMGSAAELQAKGPGMETLPIPPGAGDSGTLKPIGKKKAGKKKTETKAKVGKAAGTAAIDAEAVEGLVKRAVAKAAKKAKRRERRLTKSLGQTKRKLTKQSGDLAKALAGPDPRSHAHRGASPRQFTPKVADPEKVQNAKQEATRIRTLKMRAKDGNSQTSQAAIAELMERLAPAEFAKVMAADTE